MQAPLSRRVPAVLSALRWTGIPRNSRISLRTRMLALSCTSLRCLLSTIPARVLCLTWEWLCFISCWSNVAWMTKVWSMTCVSGSCTLHLSSWMQRCMCSWRFPLKTPNMPLTSPRMLLPLGVTACFLFFFSSSFRLAALLPLALLLVLLLSLARALPVLPPLWLTMPSVHSKRAPRSSATGGGRRRGTCQPCPVWPRHWHLSSPLPGWWCRFRP
mmetsp:Transcript_44763/g.133739  ORF Transcript_44763/g.133739 Transcript_44763/m.133739 type:complete len:215 (-) Transcript_44763:663-1307(-)